MSTTKLELADKVFEHMKTDKQQATQLVDMFFEELKTALVKEGELHISGFGKFLVKQKKARNGRNPQTGSSMTIEERKVASFHHSQTLKTRLNSGK